MERPMKPFHKHARIGREGDRLPWGNRLFGQGTDIPGYEIVDPREPLTAQLIGDKSIVLEEPPAPEAKSEDKKSEDKPEAKPVEPASDHHASEPAPRA